MIKKYRKKSEIIEAIQVNWKNWKEVQKLLGEHVNKKDNPVREVYTYYDNCGEKKPYIEFSILDIPRAIYIVQHGYFVIKRGGKFECCKPEIFNDTYEVVE